MSSLRARSSCCWREERPLARSFRLMRNTHLRRAYDNIRQRVICWNRFIRLHCCVCASFHWELKKKSLD